MHLASLLDGVHIICDFKKLGRCVEKVLINNVFVTNSKALSFVFERCGVQYGDDEAFENMERICEETETDHLNTASDIGVCANFNCERQIRSANYDHKGLNH